MKSSLVQKSETFFLVATSILLVVWRWYLDSVKATYIEIGRVVVPSWWWYIILLLVITFASFSEVKRSSATGILTKVLGSPYWFISVLVTALALLFFCNYNSCSSKVMELIRFLTLTISFVQLLSVIWLGYKRK